MAGYAIGDEIRARRYFADGTYEYNYGYVISHPAPGKVELHFTDGTTKTFPTRDLAF